MKIFVDANVLVAVLNRQYPLFTYAARVLSLADSRKHLVFTSPVCLAIAFYFAEKKGGTKEAKRKIAILVEKLKITSTDENVVKRSINNPAIHDFEDGIQYYSALSAGCSMIITEDIQDFYFSQVPVLGCEDFLKQIV